VPFRFIPGCCNNNATEHLFHLTTTTTQPDIPRSHLRFLPMKKPTLFILPLAALIAAGCTSDDYASHTNSPWRAEGSGGEPNVIARTFTTDDDVYSADAPLAEQNFPRIKQRARPAIVDVAPTVNTTPPEDPYHFRITDVRANHALFQFVSLGAFTVGQRINANDGKSAGTLRVLALDEAKKSVVVEILPGKVDLPKFEVGVELGYLFLNAEGQEIAPNAEAPGASAIAGAVEPAPAAPDAAVAEAPAAPAAEAAVPALDVPAEAPAPPPAAEVPVAPEPPPAL
jgi:hypothetical protein